MNPSVSNQPLLAATLDQLVTSTGDEASLEASLLSQANVLSMIFKYQVQRALTHGEGSQQADDAIRLAMKAQTQSGRILQDLVRAKRASGKASATSRRQAKSAPPAPEATPAPAAPTPPEKETPRPQAATTPPAPEAIPARSAAPAAAWPVPEDTASPPGHPSRRMVPGRFPQVRPGMRSPGAMASETGCPDRSLNPPAAGPAERAFHP